MPNHLPADKLLHDYLYDLKIQNKSAGSIYRYRKSLERYLKFCEELQIHLCDIQRRDIKRYLFGLERLKPTSVHNSLSIVSSFYEWMIKEEFTVSNPVKLVDKPKIGKRLPIYPSPEEKERLVTYIRSNVPLKTGVAIEVMLASGLRVSELVKLKQSDLKLKTTTDQKTYHLLSVIGKGNKQREVPITRETVDRLNELIASLKEGGNETEYLFPKKQEHLHFSERQMRAHLSNICQKAGIKHYSPHKFRHFYGTSLYQRTGDPFLVAKLLGHERIETTSIYAHVEIDNVAHRIGATEDILPPGAAQLTLEQTPSAVTTEATT